MKVTLKHGYDDITLVFPTKLAAFNMINGIDDNQIESITVNVKTPEEMRPKEVDDEVH